MSKFFSYDILPIHSKSGLLPLNRVREQKKMLFLALLVYRHHDDLCNKIK